MGDVDVVGKRDAHRFGGPRVGGSTLQSHQIHTPSGTYVQQNIGLTAGAGHRENDMDVEPSSDGPEVSVPTAKEKQWITWRDIIIPGLIQPYANLLASTDNLARLDEVKATGIRCSGCPKGVGNPVKIICLHFDRGLCKDI